MIFACSNVYSVMKHTLPRCSTGECSYGLITQEKVTNDTIYPQITTHRNKIEKKEKERKEKEETVDSREL